LAQSKSHIREFPLTEKSHVAILTSEKQFPGGYV